MARRGETREKILKAAEKVFFENGYEAASVKMIIEEAGIVTGSFYHFFSSKEALFEAVIEEFLKGYTVRIGKILDNEQLTFGQVTEAFLNELLTSSKVYYEVLQGDKLHWTIQAALHQMTCETMIVSLADYFGRMRKEGKAEYLLSCDDMTMARIFYRGSEAIIHSSEEMLTDKEKLKESLLEFWRRIISF